jgi:hypothetical protein
MESKIDNSHKKYSNTFIPLLPTYFKKIGLSLLILTFLPAIIVKVKSIEMVEAQLETMKYLSINLFILGMLLIAWAKNKVEDEITIALRIKSMVFAFIFAAFSVVLKPLSDLLLGTPIADMKGQNIVFSMLVVYFVTYFFHKKGR